jgi:hypothetical protein
MEMLKDELKALYKAKPELIEEHKRLVDVLRTGSKKEQAAEAERQLKELKEMVGKADRCWEGYEPTPGKKPYEKGSCQPIKKQEGLALDKQESGRGWQIKIKGKEGYHDVKDVVDMGPQKHNSYLLHDGTTVPHEQVEDLSFSAKMPNRVEKSNYGPKGMALYNSTDNIKRKSTRTGEVLENVGQNQAVREYTSSTFGTAAQQAGRQAAEDKRKSAKNPVRSMKDMSEAELASIKAKYQDTSKAELDDKIAAVKAKYSAPKEKSFQEKINQIKQKHADKPQLTEDQRVGAIKMKYTSMFKSQDMQRLLQEVAARQPTDAELEAILEYNSRVAQEIANTPSQINEEDFGY